MIAIIFDMDGVLVDGEPLHFAAAGEILAPLGIDLDIETYKGYMGRTGHDIWEDLRGRFGLHLDYDVYQRRYGAAVLEAYRTQTRALPGARALLDRLHAARIPCALASSSRREWVRTALDVLDFARYFRVVVAGDEIAAGKPDPEIYRTAAERLGVAPADCVAFEDAPAGIASARSAGMRVVAVRTDLNRGLALDGADRVLDSLEQVDLTWLTPGGVQPASAAG